MRKKIEVLLKSDLTAYKLSKESGVTTSLFLELRNGKRKLDNITLKILEKLLKCYENAKAEIKMITIEMKEVQFNGDVFENGTEFVDYLKGLNEFKYLDEFEYHRVPSGKYKDTQNDFIKYIEKEFQTSSKRFTLYADCNLDERIERYCRLNGIDFDEIESIGEIELFEYDFDKNTITIDLSNVKENEKELIQTILANL